MQTNLIWGRGEDPNDTSGYGGAEVRLNNLNKLAGSLGLKAMWSFGSECEKGLQVYQEPVNTTACKRPFSLATFSHHTDAPVFHSTVLESHLGPKAWQKTGRLQCRGLVTCWLTRRT